MGYLRHVGDSFLSWILHAYHGASIAVSCQHMSISRQADDPSIQVRSFGVTFRSGHAADPLAISPSGHDWHKLIYATRGVMTVRTDRGAWVLPPHRAVWIPAGFKYAVEL